MKVQQIGRELGVRNVLEGSIQKSGDRLRIIAQLIDATTGNHLWAEKYDRDMKDIFTLQDDITLNVLKALRVALTEGEQARLYGRDTNNLEAYLKYLRAFQFVTYPTRKSIVQARQLLEEAIVLDPKYSDAHRQLGAVHL